MFIDCTFSNCRFNDRVLQAANIVNCTFAGKLIDITFDGNGKQKLIANFENCTLDGVRFIGCDLGHVFRQHPNTIYMLNMYLHV